MARRARMLALLQLSSLVFLLVAELTHAAPVSDGSSTNTIHADSDGVFSEKRSDIAHTVAPSEDKPGDFVAESGHHTTTTQDVNSVPKEDDIHEDSMVTKTATSVEAAEENVLIEEVSENNMDKDKNSFSIKSDDNTGAADSSPAVSEANVDTLVTKSGENGKTTESSKTAFEENAGMHEDHTSIENEEFKSARGTSDSVSEESVEENEYPMATKPGENASDAESKENIEIVDGSIIGTTGKDASTPGDSEKVPEQIGTIVTGDVSSEDSQDFVDAFKDKKFENDAVESSSSDKGSEENKENEKAEETALKGDDTSEDEVSEESSKETKGEHGAALGNSSEETSDAENEAGDVEVNENHSSMHQESHVTSSPFARLSLPSSDNHHIEKDEHSDKDAAMEGDERNQSVEETAENEAGSPDELIEHDRVDSEVLKNDNKTAALGKAMPITKAEEDAQNKDESLQDTSKDSEAPVVFKGLENIEGKNSIEDQDLNNEKVEATISGAPESIHETDSKDIVLGGKLLKEENEKDNFLDKDDMDSKTHLAHSEKNEDGFVVAEEALNIVHTTENPSEDEGSGIMPDVVGFASHGDNAHKDMSETSSEEKHETEITDRKEDNKDEDAVVSEKEDTKISKESDHHTDGFGDSGSGHYEEEHDPFGKQASNRMDDAEDGAGSGSHALPGQYDDMASEEHTTKSNFITHVPIIGDSEESVAGYPSESPAPENESSTKIAVFEQANDQNESLGHLKEENFGQNDTNVQAMSLNPTPISDESDDHHVTFDGSGDDDTTTPVASTILADIIDDNMAVSGMEMELVNSSVIGEASPAYQEGPVEKVILHQLAGAPPPPTTEPPCIADEENDCFLQSNKTHKDAGVTNIFEDDDEVPPEPTKGDIHTKSTNSDDLKELEDVISTTAAVKMSSEEESLQQSISVDLNMPPLHSNEEISSTTIAPEIQEITEPTIVDHEAMDNETININAQDIIVEHPVDETGIKEMSGKIREVNVNEIGVSGKENLDDVGESEALDSSTASGSYVVLGCIMAVVVVLLAYAAIKSRRERGANTNSKKQSEVAGDDDDGTELKDMKKALLPPETPHDDRNGDIEANRKPLMDKEENQEEDEKEPIIKQNGTLELSEPPRDIESQVDSSVSENQLKSAPTPTKPQQRNGLSEVVVEKPAISNGKADSIITHPVAAKVKVIENEDSIAKTPVIINRGGNSPPH